MDGQVVVVGATGTLGSAVVARLAGNGVPVLAVARDETALHALAARHNGVSWCAADIADDTAIAQIWDALAGPVGFAVFAPGLAVRGSIDVIEPSALAVAANVKLGTQLDAHCTGIGKVLLAYRDPAEVERWLRHASLRRLTEATITDPAVLTNELQQARLAGYAYDLGEAVPDVHCVAAPVKDDLGAVVAAISMTVPASRFLPRKAELKRAVVGGAARITARLAHVGERDTRPR